MLKDISLSALLAGFVTVLVGFTSSAVIIFQAAATLGAGPRESASWIWALGMGMGVVSLWLSWRYRMPLVAAWSTPGAAMLITGAAGVSLPEATAAFMVAAVLTMLAGFSGWFEKSIRRIPVTLASAMLAGVLLRFGLDAVLALQTQFALVLGMMLAYLLARRFAPRYAVMGAFVVGLLISAVSGLLHDMPVALEFARPVMVTPVFSWSATLGVALPLFIVTMASQNLPGVAVARASGYALPVSVVVGCMGLVTLLLAPFGAFAVSLAAISAAVCVGKEAHELPEKRYVAAMAAGVFYILAGLFGATIVSVFAALPRELVLAIAGIALLGSIGSGLAGAFTVEEDREPALVTFLVTASGVSLAGMGAAFWGLLAGVLTWCLLRWRVRRLAVA